MLNETAFLTAMQNKTSEDIAAYISQNTYLPTFLIVFGIFYISLLICGMAMTQNKLKFMKILLVPTLILILLLILTIAYPAIPIWTGNWVNNFLSFLAN